MHHYLSPHFHDEAWPPLPRIEIADIRPVQLCFLLDNLQHLRWEFDHRGGGEIPTLPTLKHLQSLHLVLPPALEALYRQIPLVSFKRHPVLQYLRIETADQREHLRMKTQWFDGAPSTLRGLYLANLHFDRNMFFCISTWWPMLENLYLGRCTHDDLGLNRVEPLDSLLFLGILRPLKAMKLSGCREFKSLRYPSQTRVVRRGEWQIRTSADNTAEMTVLQSFPSVLSSTQPLLEVVQVGLRSHVRYQPANRNGVVPIC